MLEIVHLIRHGESEANTKHLVCGQLDSPLSENGTREVIRAGSADSIRDLLHLPCYTTPLKRALHTAELLSFKNITIVDEFVETNTGDLSLKLMSEIRETHPQFNHHATDLHACYPGGESTFEMLQRVIKKFNNISLEHKEIVVVAHGGPLNSIAGNLMGVSFDSFPSFLFENNKITTLKRNRRDIKFWSISRMNFL